MNPQNKKNKRNQHISLILLTKNETQNITKNFGWVKKCPTINEIIAIDDLSTDTTTTKLKKLTTPNLTVKIFKRYLQANFAQQRNFALSHTTNNWILWLDADEKPSPKTISFLANFTFDQKLSFAFKRQDTFLGHQLKHGETNSLNFIRLFNKNYGLFERPIHEIWHSRLPVKNTSFVIYHHPHPTITSLLAKINLYTDIRAQELFDQKVPASIFQIIFLPLAKFIQNYLFRLGFLDQTAGIILALSMSLHSFLVRAKLWHKWQKSS